MHDARWEAIYTRANVAAMTPGSAYGALHDAAIAVANGRIAWMGPMAAIPREHAGGVETHDVEGRWITPGLIDCHTHLVYAGNRAHEFEQRLNGVSYQDITRRGGGIASTVAATRTVDDDALFHASAKRLRALLREGVTTIEIKSGYGLDHATEARMLRVARRLGEAFDVTVRTTYLGAHAVPVEYRDRADEYIEFACREVLPALVSEGLVDAVDAFCETIAFTPAQTGRVFDAARALGLPVKLHADQLSDQGGAALAARYGALSADHLEHASSAGIAALAQGRTTAVLLPIAFYFLRDTHAPPIDALRRADVPIAIATDCNPGTSPATSLLLALNMACTLFRLTPAEALAGVTRNAARAVGLDATCGTLEPGKAADFVIWNDIESPGELAYRLGYNPCHGVVRAGRLRTMD